MSTESAIVARRTQVASEDGLCVAGHEAEARAGARMLAEGGNAVDALVAAAFTAYVVEPWNCGLGGYGRLAIYVSEGLTPLMQAFVGRVSLIPLNVWDGNSGLRERGVLSVTGATIAGDGRF